MEPNLTSTEGRAEACKAIIKALESDTSPLAPHIRLLAKIVEAEQRAEEYPV